MTDPGKDPLLPDRHPQGDFFVCDIFDAAPKGDMASMEHPIFSVSTKPDRNIRRYENGSNFVEIHPSTHGLATVHDRDVLIYCISQCIAALNDGKEISKTLRFSALELLKATNRMTGGDGYKRLKSALERLAGTRIETNIITGNQEILDNFGLIDRFRIVRETREGRMQELEVQLSDWVFNAIRHKEVLTLSRGYFRLRKPLERRLYEIARKHCGTKPSWRIGLDKLRNKCGSNSSTREFRLLVGKIIEEDEEHGHMPDYAIRFDDDDTVVFIARGSVPVAEEIEGLSIPRLDADAYEQAREAAPGWDVYVVEQEWRAWCAKEEVVPNRPDAHFLKFCRSWYERRGAPS